MARHKWQIFLGLSLILLSSLLYFGHYLIFRDIHHIFIYLVGDIAFVPIEVLLVTLIIHRLLSFREKRNRLEKMNMVIGAFFSEIGTKLLTVLSDSDPNLNDIKNNLLITTEWTDKQFINVSKKLKAYKYSIGIEKLDLEALRSLLIENRGFLLRLLENPALLEHESFTELLRAVFHATEELDHRDIIKELPAIDIKHLINDAARAYSLLVSEWIDYMKHLKDNYPYMFSLALRTNPFDQSATPVVK